MCQTKDTNIDHSRPTAPPCYRDQMGKLSPIVSEFDNTDDEESHRRWFVAKVAASFADTRPDTPHDAVMAELDNIVAQAEAASPAS